MIRKVKVWLIDALGGIPIEEKQQDDYHSYQFGVYCSLLHIRTFAEKMNGLQADEWCKRMYEYIDGNIRKMESQKENNGKEKQNV